MSKKIEKKELQTRREFFKKAAKGALPIVAGIIMSAMPQVVNATSKIAMGCELGCHSGCYRSCDKGCKGCKGGCNTNCAVSCDRTCRATCADDCYKSCTGGNEPYRE